MDQTVCHRSLRPPNGLALLNNLIRWMITTDLEAEGSLDGETARQEHCLGLIPASRLQQSSLTRKGSGRVRLCENSHVGSRKSTSAEYLSMPSFGFLWFVGPDIAWNDVSDDHNTRDGHMSAARS